MSIQSGNASDDFLPSTSTASAQYPIILLRVNPSLIKSISNVHVFSNKVVVDKESTFNVFIVDLKIPSIPE